MFKVKKGMRGLVVGLGKSGVAATKLLCKKGIKVRVTDELNKTDLKESLDQLEGLEFELELGKHVLKSFTDTDFIVLSPGVRRDIKPLQQAEKQKLPIMSELELAAQFIAEPIVAVTGTNGKTTTAALIAEMISTGGKTVFLGGSSGIPLSEYAARREKCDWVVVEVSSFQLEATYSLKPHVAVFLNVAPDHLDRYPTFDQYVETKLKLRANLTPEDYVVTNLRDAKLMAGLGDTQAKLVTFTTDAWARIPSHYQEKFQGTYLEPSSTIHLKTARWKEHSFPLAGTLLRGLHNRENMMAATLAAKLVGVTNESIQKVLTTFKPLAHRLEPVGRRNQVLFVNDSKGTNVHALMRTLEAFHEPVILIAGGKDKGEDFTPLIPFVRRHVKNLILIGESKERMNRTIGDFSETFLVGTFEEAVYVAYQKSRSGDVVLLSPGCSSRDMFKSFEERGDRFRRLVGTF